MIGWMGLIKAETEIQRWQGCEGRAESGTVSSAGMYRGM